MFLITSPKDPVARVFYQVCKNKFDFFNLIPDLEGTVCLLYLEPNIYGWIKY